MSVLASPIANQLLQALPQEDGLRLSAQFEPVELQLSEILYLPGQLIQAVYFPLGSVICLKSRQIEHDSLAVGMVGDEGMLGASLLLGNDEAPLQALVQSPGLALRLARAPFQRELARSVALQRAVRRYLYTLMAQLAQTAACARFHLLLARLARWLLMTQDRTHSDAFHLTHVFLAQMLGVRRVGVTSAASSLQAQKLIHYSRGDITVLNRAGLEDAACGCYAADKASYRRGMPMAAAGV